MSEDYYPGLPAQYRARIHLAVVLATEWISAGMVRITLGGADMHDYPTTGVGDEYVRLFFPDEPDAKVRLPFLTDRGWDFAEGVEPSQMRTYTVRRHRSGEIDIDFVVHPGGIASTWAEQAKPGQEIGINPPKALYERPSWARRQVLLADEPALPAALRIAELTAPEIETVVFAEVRGTKYQLGGLPEQAKCVWLRGGNGHAPSELASALRRAEVDEGTYVWVAGETRLSREVRGHLRSEREIAKDGYRSVGYWTDRAEEWRARYDELGADFHARVEELYASDRDSEEIVDAVNQLYEAAGL